MCWLCFKYAKLTIMNSRSLPKVARLLNSKVGTIELPPTILMTDDLRGPNPIQSIKKLDPKCGIVFRHYNTKSRFKLGLKVKRVCQKKKILFIVAGSYSLACKLDADGLHLPEYKLLACPLKVRMWSRRPNKILTASAHSHSTLMKCRDLPVNAVMVSPVFKTESHPNQEALGISRFQKLASSTPTPIYALGGINNANAAQLLNSPAIGIAGISAIAE